MAFGDDQHVMLVVRGQAVSDVGFGSVMDEVPAGMAEGAGVAFF